MFLLLGRTGLPKVGLMVVLAGLASILWGPAQVQAAAQASNRRPRSAAVRRELTQKAFAVKTLDKVDNLRAHAALQVTGTVTATTTATATGSVIPSPTITGTATPTATAATPQPTNTPTATETPNPGAPTPTTPANATAATSTPSVMITATAATTQTQTPVATSVSAPGILAFDAKPSTVNAGGSTVLSWRLVNAETARLRASHDEETLATSGNKIEGSKLITPTESTVYTLIARSQGGEASRQVTITVNSSVVTPTLAASLLITSSGNVSPTQAVTAPTNATPLIQVMTPSPTPVLQVIVPASPLLTTTTALTPLRSSVTLPVAPVDLDPQSPPPDPVQTQQLLLFGVLAAALMVPFGIASLALLIWVIGRQL
ncbi:MAG: hypothetical protein U0350_22740 [Caldilineaceae bacterium]